MPTPTDLVTDLPADFEVFGQAVDTSMADLKGGTTGQILSKATNADMDFTWITNDVGDITAVTVSSPLTGGGTSGSISVGILSGTTSNLGAVQLSDSTSSTSTTLAATANAVKTTYDLANSAYAGAFTNNFYAGKNKVINSAFQIWQRGTSIAGATAVNYAADQWQLFRAGTTLTRQATGDTTNLPNIQYCARVQRNSGTTGTAAVLLSQSVETSNAIPYAGRTVTLSFYARKGADYSGASSGMGATVFTGTGTDQNYISGFTGVATAFTFAPTLTSTWQRFTQTGSIASTATELAVNFSYEPVGTAGANDYFEVTGVQLEIGSVATPFQTASGSIGGELALCQRYYYRNAPGSGNAIIGLGLASSTTLARIQFAPKVTMRIAPTSIEYAGNYLTDGVSAFTTLLSIVNSSAGANSLAASVTIATGLTQFRNYELDTLNTTDYIAWSAEL
jgi:uncharacterized membrane protein